MQCKFGAPFSVRQIKYLWPTKHKKATTQTATGRARTAQRQSKSSAMKALRQRGGIAAAELNQSHRREVNDRHWESARRRRKKERKREERSKAREREEEGNQSGKRESASTFTTAAAPKCQSGSRCRLNFGFLCFIPSLSLSHSFLQHSARSCLPWPIVS